MKQDQWLVRMIAGGLLTICAIALLGSIGLVAIHRPIPEVIKALATASLGALTAFLVSTRGGGVDESQPVTVTNTPADPVPVDPTPPPPPLP